MIDNTDTSIPDPEPDVRPPSHAPVEAWGSVLRIVTLAMAVVTGCIAIALVIVVANERSTQASADRQSELNETLQNELACLRDPAFQADKADSELSIIIARGLAAVAAGDQTALTLLTSDLEAGADLLDQKLSLREQSIHLCETSSRRLTPTGNATP